MKKIIGIVAALLLMSSSLNANETKASEEFVDCIALAFAVNDLVGGIPFEVFDAIIDACEAAQ